MTCHLPLRAAVAALALFAVSCSGERPVLLTEAGPVTSADGDATTVDSADTTNTTAVPAEAPALTEADCITASGSAWQLMIEPTPTPPVACLLVAGHQRIEFINNTSDVVSFDLAGISVAIEPGTSFQAEPTGTFLPAGATDLNATPHPISELWLIDGEQRALSGEPLGLDRLGPVAIGAAPADFGSAIDGRSLPTADAACYVTSLVGDPYSPLFTVTNGAVSVIQVFSPGQLTRSQIGVGSSEGDVLTAYGQQIESQPSPDGDANKKLLVFVPGDEADQQYRLVFVVEAGVVTSSRIGFTEPVLANPGCG